MTALASHDRLVLIFEKTLLSYPLEHLTSVALGSKPVEEILEMLAPQHKGHVAFFRVGSFGGQDYRTSLSVVHSRVERGIRYSRSEIVL